MITKTFKVVKRFSFVTDKPNILKVKSYSDDGKNKLPPTADTIYETVKTGLSFAEAKALRKTGKNLLIVPESQKK
jgi:hypothetical protein